MRLFIGFILAGLLGLVGCQNMPLQHQTGHMKGGQTTLDQTVRLTMADGSKVDVITVGRQEKIGNHTYLNVGTTSGPLQLRIEHIAIVEGGDLKTLLARRPEARDGRGNDQRGGYGPQGREGRGNDERGGRGGPQGWEGRGGPGGGPGRGMGPGGPGGGPGMGPRGGMDQRGMRGGERDRRPTTQKATEKKESETKKSETKSSTAPKTDK